MASWSVPESEYGDYAPTRPDPKPPRRIRASQADWADIHQGFKDAVCAHCAHRPVELHHVLPRSQRGDDVWENLCPLCRTCHTLLESHGPGWERVGASVRQYVITDNDRRRYQEDHAGESFNRRYPPLPHPDQEQIARDYQTIIESHAVEGVEW